MKLTMKPQKIEISYKTIVFTVLFLIFLWVLYQIRSIILLVFIGFIIMNAFQPVVKLASRIRLPVLPVMLILYLGILSLLSMVIASLIPAVIDQSKSLVLHYPDYLSSLESTLNLKLDPTWGASYLTGIPSNLLKFAGSAFSNVLNLLAVFFIAYYLTIERPYLHKYLIKLFGGGDAEKKAETLVQDVERAVGGWVRGELILMLIIGLMTYAGLSLLG